MSMLKVWALRLRVPIKPASLACPFLKIQNNNKKFYNWSWIAVDGISIRKEMPLLTSYMLNVKPTKTLIVLDHTESLFDVSNNSKLHKFP